MIVTCEQVLKGPTPILYSKTCSETNTYVSEFCQETYQQFLSRHTYIINCPPGRGKSYMITNNIVSKAYWQRKKVLILANRKKLADQYNKDEMKVVINGDVDYAPSTHSLCNNRDPCSVIMSYQQLEEMIKNNMQNTLEELDKFDIVVADEIHYLLCDSTFNPKTRLSAEAVLMFLAPKTRYFLSATMDDIGSIIKKPWQIFKPIFTSEDRFLFTESRAYHTYPPNTNLAVTFYEYTMPEDYSYLEVFYYRNQDTIIDHIVNFESNEKCLYFVQSIEDGEKLEDLINLRYRESHPNSNKKIATFVSSEYRQADQTEMKKILDDITETEDFKEKVLITTSVLYNGINIKSKDLVHIVIDTDNSVSFIQMLGRRRKVSTADKVNLYISAGKPKLFMDRLNDFELIFSHINQVSFMDFDKFVTNLFYSGETVLSKSFSRVVFPMTRFVDGYNRSDFIINELSLHQLRLMIKNYRNILQRFENEGNNAFIYEQLSWIGISYNENNWLQDTSTKRLRKTIDSKLIQYVNQEFTEQELNKILEEIKPEARKIVPEIRNNRISCPQAARALELVNSSYKINKINKGMFMISLMNDESPDYPKTKEVTE